MSRTPFRWGLLALTLLPAVAFAASADSHIVLDVTSGAIGEMAKKTLTIAKSLWVPLLIVGLFFEGFGLSPTAKRDLGGQAYRAVAILLLLMAYPRVMGSVINLAGYVSNQATPSQSFVDFQRYVAGHLAVLSQRSDLEEQLKKTTAALGGTPKEESSATMDFVDRAGQQLGGYFFGSVMTLLILLGEVAHFIVRYIGTALLGLFYVLGPLALVFAVPRGSGSGGRWFSSFVAFASWPIFSGVLLQMVMAMGYGQLGSALADQKDMASHAVAMVVSLVLAPTACAVPFLASSIVGGAARNLASDGWSSALSGAQLVSQGISGAAAVTAAAGGVGAGAASGSASAGAGVASQTVADPTRFNPSELPGLQHAPAPPAQSMEVERGSAADVRQSSESAPLPAPPLPVRQPSDSQTARPSTPSPAPNVISLERSPDRPGIGGPPVSRSRAPTRT